MDYTDTGSKREWGFGDTLGGDSSLRGVQRWIERTTEGIDFNGRYLKVTPVETKR
jgi:hypothetical protein